MKISKRFLAAAVCAVTAAGSMTAPLQAGFAAAELEESLANDSGLDYDFARALQYSMFMYDANMCGTEVDENNLYTWRGDCHTYDAQVPMQTMESITSPGTNLSQDFMNQYADVLDPDGDGYIDVAGGFHDAGDHVKFGMPENYAASTLGWGYYEFRDAYAATGQDSHIETILRYFNDYLMKCTFRDDSGTVIAHCYQVGEGGLDHKTWNSPEVDTMARPAWFLTADKPQTDYAVSAAASLAINYLNFKDTDLEYAEKSLDYAVALFDFAKTNEKQLSDNADGPMAFYNSSKWQDDYCWAAAWLYKITGDYMYLEEIFPYYDYYAAPCYVHCWNDVWGGVQCILGEISMDAPLKEGEHVYPGFIDDYKVAANKSPYEEMDCWASVAKAIETYQNGGVGTITPAGYWWLNTWGSARYNTAAQLMALVYDKYNNNGPGAYSDWAKGQMEYIMGDNPLGRSYIVGYNENSVKFPHHRAASGLTKCEDLDEHRYVLYGALAGGPDANDQHNDTTADWIYNEVTIDYNAAFVGACAGLYEFYGTDEMAPTTNFPPTPSYSSEGGGGGNGYWVEACGIDDLNADGAGVTKVSFMVMTDSTKVLDNTTVRYFFNSSEMSSALNASASKLYDQSSAEADTVGAVISGPHKYDKAEDTYYVDFTWSDYNIANSGKKYQFTLGLYYGDKWVPSNDWSYQDLTIYTEDSAFFGTGYEVKTDYICVYSDGELIGGIEPDGSTPQQPTTEPATDPVTDPTTVTTTEPTTAPPTTTTPDVPTTTDGSDDIVFGDADCSGKVEIADVVAIMIHISTPGGTLTAAGIINADVYQRGDDIGNMDALAVQKSIAQLITSLPESYME